MLVPSPPPSLHEDYPAWSDEVWASPLDIRRRIFCNRSLNMASIKVASSISFVAHVPAETLAGTQHSCLGWARPESSSRGCIGCKLQAVGFDMDYTLSQYRPETFELLAYTLTVQKLVEAFGYPKVNCSWSL